MAYISYPVMFNSVDPTIVPGLTVLGVNHSLPPKRELSMDRLSRTSSSRVRTGFYTSKDIVIRVGISRTTRPLAEKSLELLFGYIQGIEKELIITQSGALRRYTASYSDYIVREYGGSYIELDLVFTCSDRFGYGLQYEKLLDATGRTLYNYTDTLTIEGTADTQEVVITAFLSAVGAGTSNQVRIGNVGGNQFITVNRTWTAGNRLVIDVPNRTVKVDGADVEYSGFFPLFAPGSGYLQYQDNFSTRTLALSVYYYKRFI